MLPVSCSDLSKSRTWALVLHKIAALQIKATGANKGQSVIVLLRPAFLLSATVLLFWTHAHFGFTLWMMLCFGFAHYDRFPSLWNSKGYLNLSLKGFTIFVRTFRKNGLHNCSYTCKPAWTPNLIIHFWFPLCDRWGDQYRSTSSHSISLLNGDMILTKSSPRHVT